MTASQRHCLETVRAGDRAAYLGALLAPQPARHHLLALHALDVELAAVRERITEPLAGEIRLQWWRDAIAGLAIQGDHGNPVLAGLQGAIGAAKLPLSAFDAMIEARIFDLYDDPMPDSAALEAYLGQVRGAIVQLSCVILAPGRNPNSGTAAGHAAMATGIAWILQNLPKHSARGQSYIPAELLTRHGLSAGALRETGQLEEKRAVVADLRALARLHLGKTRKALATLPRSLRPAFATCGLVEPLIRAGAGAVDPFRDPVFVSPLAQQWRIWRGGRGKF